MATASGALSSENLEGENPQGVSLETVRDDHFDEGTRPGIVFAG